MLLRLTLCPVSTSPWRCWSPTCLSPHLRRQCPLLPSRSSHLYHPYLFIHLRHPWFCFANDLCLYYVTCYTSPSPFIPFSSFLLLLLLFFLVFIDNCLFRYFYLWSHLLVFCSNSTKPLVLSCTFLVSCLCERILFLTFLINSPVLSCLYGSLAFLLHDLFCFIPVSLTSLLPSLYLRYPSSC